MERHLVERLRAHHQRTLDAYLVAERAILIAAALGAVPADLTQRRDETRHLAAGYAQLVASASAAGA